MFGLMINDDPEDGRTAKGTRAYNNNMGESRATSLTLAPIPIIDCIQTVGLHNLSNERFSI